MSYLKKLAGQTAIYGFSSVVPRLLNYILVPLYTRVFLPEEYGVVTEMYAYLAFLLILLTYGMETGFFRFATKDEDSSLTYSTAFYSLLTSSVLFIGLVYLFSNSISSLLQYPNNPEYVKLLVIIIGIDAFTTIPFAKLRLENRPILFAFLKISGVVLNVLLNFFFLTVCPQVEFFTTIGLYDPSLGVTYVFISNLISSLFVLVLLFFIPGIVPRTFSFARLKIILVYSFPLLISGLGGTTNESFDRIFLKYLIDPTNDPLYQLGIYGSNVKLAVLMVLFIQMYRYAAEPFFFSNANRSDSPTMYANMMKYFLIFTLLIFLGVGLFTDVFKYLVGPNFREGLGVVPILLLANLFYGLFFNFSIWYKLTNKTWYGIYYTFTGAAVTLVLYFTLIPKIGYYGAAVARLSCYILMAYLCYRGGKKFFPIPYDLKRMGIYLLSAIIVFSLGYFININILFLSFLYRFALVGAFLYIVILNEGINVKSLIISLVHESKSNK
jgi:O-antigen/teichoic acid export membrane protein